jgi:outer membrane receptor protein involved in Fe transport
VGGVLVGANDIKPGDIETVEIIKGPAAAALYANTAALRS